MEKILEEQNLSELTQKEQGDNLVKQVTSSERESSPSIPKKCKYSVYIVCLINSL